MRLKKYLYSFQYSSNVLEFFPHAEGYVKATAMDFGGNISGYAYNYVFNHSDHLDERVQSIALSEVCERSSVRVSYAKDPQTGNLKILDENHYYPFGLRHGKYAQSGFVLGYQDVILAPVADSPYKYKYNGKELQDELGLNMYDMDMRMYEPAIARWVVMDPIIHHSMSPYNAFDNNPVFWADPGGADSESNNDNGGGYSTGVTLAFGVSLDSVINGGAAVGFSGNLQSIGDANNNNGTGKNNGDPKNGDPNAKKDGALASNSNNKPLKEKGSGSALSKYKTNKSGNNKSTVSSKDQKNSKGLITTTKTERVEGIPKIDIPLTLKIYPATDVITEGEAGLVNFDVSSNHTNGTMMLSLEKSIGAISESIGSSGYSAKIMPGDIGIGISANPSFITVSTLNNVGNNTTTSMNYEIGPVGQMVLGVIGAVIISNPQLAPAAAAF